LEFYMKFATRYYPKQVQVIKRQVFMETDPDPDPASPAYQSELKDMLQCPQVRKVDPVTVQVERPMV
jgi:hypothetical protein